MKSYGIDIQITEKPLGFVYGLGVHGPKPEIRTLESIRASLLDNESKGPSQLYAIAMDVYRSEDRSLLDERNLLFGVVTYQKGTIGKEPIRSQGHIHAISPSCQSSTCEVYEIWEGEAYIYMQRSSSDNAGDCYAVHARKGDIVVVPPGYLHATINADVTRHMTFGAWCVKDYGFDYDAVKKHHGIAFFPIVESGEISWQFNKNYQDGKLYVVAARTYKELGIIPNVPIYQQFVDNPDRFLFVARPELAKDVWKEMENGY